MATLSTKMLNSFSMSSKDFESCVISRSVSSKAFLASTSSRVLDAPPSTEMRPRVHSLTVLPMSPASPCSLRLSRSPFCAASARKPPSERATLRAARVPDDDLPFLPVPPEPAPAPVEPPPPAPSFDRSWRTNGRSTRLALACVTTLRPAVLETWLFIGAQFGLAS